MGLIFSGVASQILSWRACYWLIAIIYAIITVSAYFTMPPDISRRANLSSETVKQFDVLGTFLTVAGIGLFSCALR